MVAIPALWLPILLAAVLVFLASFVLHMVLPLHWKDYRKLPNGEPVLDALRRAQVPPGQYAFPCPGSAKELGSPEMLKAYQDGPVGMLTIRPTGKPDMSSSLVQWFAFSVVMGIFAAYLTGRALPPGADYLAVFRFAGTIAFLGYAATSATDPIWKGGSWATTARHTFDALVYSLLTAGSFAGFWPA